MKHLTPAELELRDEFIAFSYARAAKRGLYSTSPKEELEVARYIKHLTQHCRRAHDPEIERDIVNYIRLQINSGAYEHDAEAEKAAVQYVQNYDVHIHIQKIRSCVVVSTITLH